MCSSDLLVCGFINRLPFVTPLVCQSSNASIMSSLARMLRITNLQKLSKLSSESTTFVSKCTMRLKSSMATAAYDHAVKVFPSIIVGPNKSIVPNGSFAEAQAQVRSFHNSS